MGRLCERPGCSEPASVAYGMRAEDLVFWLDTLRPETYQSSGVLCQRHAESMVVPRHWTLDDLRDPVPRLFRAPARPTSKVPVVPAPTTTATVTPPAGRRRRRRAGADRTGDQLLLTGPVAGAPAAAAGSTIVEPPVESLVEPSVAPPTAPPEPVDAERSPGAAPPETIDDAPAGAAAEDGAGSVATTPWTPSFDESDDLDGLLSARSPLLARAFRGDDRPKPA